MIVCAAIQVTFQNKTGNATVVIPGWRHSSCWELMAALPGFPGQSNRQEVEGFIDHQGAFLDRYDAFNHALMCGQLSDTTRTSKAEKGERALYSEDLY